MNNRSTIRRTAAVILIGSLTVGFAGTAGARIDRDVPSDAKVGASVLDPEDGLSGTTVGASVLDEDTDISTLIAAPRKVPRGTDFDATVSVSNVGKNVARNVTCGVSTPRADAVSDFSLNFRTRVTYDDVEGNESHVFELQALPAGQTRSVRMIASAITGASAKTFTISAYCLPRRVDKRQTNNASSVIVTVI